ncbi:plastocyanin/azurin family copper-binding protein [uncultured Erythrobacter sp.]|uniref:plastocyanin/azurin family copper-binding protein n=1 Tax=uncultured Erythrobacter sp. TaxID=263913 RepID=UPI0026256096|nr:plastocyanin/azurin family copper-binding protein [uncultured Erythrobacter sp.]
MKRNTLLAAVAVASMATLSACGESPYQEPTEEATEAAATEATETEEAASTEAAAPEAPEVEANGTVIDINMYTRDPDEPSGLQVFKPRLIKAKVGDTVRFVPTDPTHQSSSIADMLPEGARGWEGEINQEVSYVLPLPGIYGYQCVPHYAAGMIGLIIVEGEGMTANLEAAKGVSHPGLAGREFTEIFEQAEADGMLN